MGTAAAVAKNDWSLRSHASSPFSQPSQGMSQNAIILIMASDEHRWKTKKDQELHPPSVARDSSWGWTKLLSLLLSWSIWKTIRVEAICLETIKQRWGLLSVFLASPCRCLDPRACPESDCTELMYNSCIAKAKHQHLLLLLLSNGWSSGFNAHPIRHDIEAYLMWCGKSFQCKLFL